MNAMSLPGSWSLPRLIHLVKANDPDADHRMPLIEAVAPVLFGGADLPLPERAGLADRLERWRYQLLNKRDGNLPPPLRELADSLDRASSRLLGEDRPPRQPRRCLSAEVPEAVRACDPAVPLEEVAREAARLTALHFPGRAGTDSPRRMLLYAPLYLSSYCVNHCRYCGFRYAREQRRDHLSLAEALAQADILGQRGFRHLLLVAGDFPRLTSTPYFVPIIAALKERGYSIAIEVAPQTTRAYAEMARAGACGVTLYQETYQLEHYARQHPLGPKVWYDWRLEGPERAAEAGLRRLGLGILLGLADPLDDLRALLGHGHYLLERFPHATLAFSLPRIHEAPDDFVPPVAVDDDLFVRLYCALRLAFPSAELVLSTREPPALRDRLAAICITQMSAGSSTAPGGYSETAGDPARHQQFPVTDQRSAAEVADALGRAGFDVQWQLAGAEAGAC